MKITSALLFMPIALLFSGCQKHPQEIDGTNNNAPSVIWKTAGVAGQVIDQNGTPVSAAQVIFGNKSIQSDDNGYFHFDQSSFNTNEAFVVVKKVGYFNGIKTFLPRSGSNNYFRIQLLDAKIAGSVDADAGGRITLSNGAIIELPAGGIVDNNNKNYTGKVTVSAAYIDPTDLRVNEQMPGDLRGINISGQQKLLKSFGMLAVELTSVTGQKLNIKSGYQAKLEFPIPESLYISAPVNIPLWFFDESSGMWKEDGKASKQATKYIGTVSHFSFWNVDESTDFIKLSLKVMNMQSNPVSGAKVKITGLTDGTSAYDFTDNLGFVDGFVPKNQPLFLEIFDNCGQEIFTKDLGTYSSDADLGNVQLNGGEISLQTITGKVVDCNGAELSSGTVQIVLDANHFEFAAVHDGSFSATFLNCSSSNSVELIAIDENTMQRGSATTLQLGSTLTEAGVLNACGIDLPPYVQLFIDGIEQLSTSTVFGGGINASTGYGDNTLPLDIFKGDTSRGVRKKTGLLLNIKVPNVLHLPDSATIVSVTVENPDGLSISDLIWYQATDQYNRMVKLSNFGDYGKIIQGDFNGKFAKLKGCCPDSETLDTVTIQARFRIKNIDPWWPD